LECGSQAAALDCARYFGAWQEEKTR